MDDHSPGPETVPIATDAQTPAGVTASVRLLFTDLRAAAEAEVALLRAYAAASGQIARRIGVWAGVAIVAFTVATMAAAFGLIFTLAQTTGPGWATLIVCSVLILLGVGALWRVKSYTRMLRRVSDEAPAIDRAERPD